MKLVYDKQINIDIGQEFYGIIASSNSTYNGIYHIIVDDIDWNTEEIIFSIAQPCRYVSCHLEEFIKYVFDSEKEARENLEELDIDEGMFKYQWI